jgi:HSP20 family molecular chaperone IbpA
MLISANRLLNDWDNFYTFRNSRYYETAWKQKEGNYVLQVNIPGFGREDVTAKVVKDVLHIHVSDSKKYAYKLPVEYDVHGTKITVDKGVMTVTVPKKLEEVPEEFEITID